MNKRTKEEEPCQLLVQKMKEHNTITMCPYCRNLFDIHVGIIYLEGKQIDPPPRDTHKHFEEVMK